MTILGQQSIAELKDLVKSKDGDITALSATFTALAPSWSTSDPAAYNDWQSDWNAFHTRYMAARELAVASINAANLLPDVGDTYIPAQTQYNAMLHALSPDGVESKNSFSQLYARLNDVYLAANKTPIPNDPPGHSLNPNIDVDLNVYRAADKLAKAGTKDSNTLLVGAGIGAGILILIKLLLL